MRRGRDPKRWGSSDLPGLDSFARAAKRAIEQALELAPEQPSLNYHGAMIDNALGNSAEARRALEQILRASPDFPEAAEAQALLQSLGD